MAKLKSITKQVTPSQYMAMRGTKNLSTINRAIQKGWKLKGVVEVAKFGRFNLLTVKVDANDNLIEAD